MAGTYLHLILNHIPVIGIYFGLLLLVIGLLKKNNFIKYLSLWLLLFIAIIAIPTYFSGEAAEHVVEKMPLVSEETMEKHEWAGQLSLIGSMLVGFFIILAFLNRIDLAAHIHNFLLFCHRF